MTATAEIVWSPQPGSQVLMLSSPVYELLYEGTRGPGKTDALLMDFAQHVGQGYGEDWRGILFRQTYPQLTEVVHKSKKWFRQIFPNAEFVGSGPGGHSWKWPTGEQLFFRHMKTPDDYWNYHGHEYPWMGWEELTNWPSNECYELMKACSRSSHKDMPRKIRATANPYGRGHNWVKAYFVDPAPRGHIVTNSEGLERVRITGYWWENKALLDADPDYPNRLRSDTNAERRKAWLKADWDIVAGGMFDDVWDRSVHVIKPFEIPESWWINRSFDWGSAKPFSVGWWAESDGTEAPNGWTYPKGSLFRIKEWYGWGGQPNKGCRMLAPDIARGIKERDGRWRIRPSPADHNIFAAERGVTMADEMEKYGVVFTKADKSPGSRKIRWDRMRTLLSNATEYVLEEPGMWIFEDCAHFIRTVPTLPRDERDPDDVDTDAEDHVADETGYRVMGLKRIARSFKFRI